MGENQKTAAVSAGPKNNIRQTLAKFTNLFVLIIVVAILSALKPEFLGVNNLINVVRQISFIAIIAVGVLPALIARGMDLSLGSIVGLTSVIVASVCHPDQAPLFVTILVGLAVGTGVGACNGLMISKGRIPAFITTLATATILRGAAMLYSDGKTISNLKESFVFLGAGRIFGIPVPIIILAFIAAVTYVILNHTRFGRHIYAIGGNPNAALIAGVNVQRVEIMVYVYAGLLAAVSSMVLTARVRSGQPGLGTGFELDAIAAAVIGGTSLSGGIGTVGGTLMGALLIGVINNGLELLGLNTYWQSIAKGVIIALAVFIDQGRKRKK